MNIQDGIDYVEGQFTCSMGAPWRWADLGMTKPYQLVEFDLDLPSAHTEEDVVHRLVSRLINRVSKLKADAGFRPDSKPKLFWRWQDKIRVENSIIQTRFYIDGNPGYQHSNPQRPSGSPIVGQIKMVA